MMKPIITLVLVLTLSLIGINCLNFCEVEQPEVKVFTTQNQIQQIALDKFIRGYDLDFTSSNSSIVQVFQPYHIADQGQVTLKAGYNVINVDGKNSHNRLWTRQGIVFAQAGPKSIAVGYGQFASGVLPKIQGFNYLQLPVESNCYSGMIYNTNLDIIIDCQSITQKPQDRTDLTCIVTKAGKITCKSFTSITKTSKRRSLIYTINNQKYLISATLTDHISAQFQNQTYLTIYHIVDDMPVFNLVVDRHTLELDSLSINDIDVVLIDDMYYIVLSDTKNRLVVFRYTADNSVQDIMTITVDGMPLQFTMSAQGTWLIATDKYVYDCTFTKSSSSLMITKKYQLDPTDSHVTDLQSSYMYIAVRTALNHLYTYDRKRTQLKYLLNRQQISQETAVVVSPFYPRLFQINNTKMVSIVISSGYLYIGQVQKSADVIVIGNSGNTSCVFNVRIQLVEQDRKIYKKKNMTSSYRLQSGRNVQFQLTEYFGGRNLQYQVTDKSKDINYALKHINKYKQNNIIPDGQTVLSSKVVDIDRKSYWLALFSEVAAHFYKCQLDNTMNINCKQNVNEKIQAKGQVFDKVDGILRTDGKAHISWTYKDSNRLDIKTFGQQGLLSIYRGGRVRYSQVLVAQKYFAYVQKQLSTVSFYSQKTLKVQSFTKNDFSQAQLASMGGGFYPRQIIDSHNNPQTFYLKFPIAIVTVSYTGGRQLQIISYTPVSKTYIADDQWQLVVGRYTLLLFVGEDVTQYAILADGNIQKLHTINMNKKAIFPIRYQLATDTAYFECQDGSIQYIRLNQGALDSQYYQLNPNKPQNKQQKQNSVGVWDVSGSWLVTGKGQAFYQYQIPTLVISTNVPDSMYKQDLSISLTVASGQQQKQQSTAKITAFNYPAKIQSSTIQDNGLILPQKGQSQLVPIPLQKYFTGAIAGYKITCPYCLQGTIQLVPPIRQVSTNAQLNTYQAIVALQDNSGSLVLKDNIIFMVNLTNNVLTYTHIQTQSTCSMMGINEGYLVVYCGTKSQQLYTFTVQVVQKKVTLLHHYPVPAQGIALRPEQIGLYKHGETITVFVHDVDIFNPTSEKSSNIKVYQLSNTDGTIAFRQQIDSSTFKIPNSQPLNSMHIHNRILLVTIGGRGIGYINLLSNKYSQSAQFVNLNQVPQLLNYTLDTTQFLRILINKQSADYTQLQALLTTSNSYSYLLQFQVDKDGIFGFKKIVQKYNRYGHQLCMNWALIDDRFVMIGYYNRTTAVRTLALYKRGAVAASGVIDFFSSHMATIPQASLKLPKAALLHLNTISQKTSFLYLDQGAKPSDQGALVLYNVTQDFHLKLTYQKPSSSNTLQVTAFNDYYQVSRNLSVQFQGAGGGIKWYSIVIVTVLVAIAVGVAFGMYLRMKRKKADSKKVSLFTENQEIDEEV